MRKNRAVKATAWSAADVILRQCFQAGTVLVLARFIAPEEFGAVAVLYLFVGVAAVLADAGLSTALIQSQSITRIDESTAFWINGFIGSLLALVFILASDFAATSLDNPELKLLVILMGLGIFFSSLGVVPIALLTKNLRFGTQMAAGVAAALLSAVISITMAVHGLGMWAVAAQVLLMSVGVALFTWILSGWAPQLAFSFSSVKRLVGFSGYVLLANIVDMTYSRAYTLLIGKKIGLAELGVYDRAEQTKQLPSNFFSLLLGRIMLPLLSEVVGEIPRFRLALRTCVKSVMLVNMPVMLGLSALGGPIILTLFGDAWVDAITPFRILCLGAVLWPLHMINVSAILASGRSGIILSMEIPKKLVGLVLLYIGISFGLEGAAWSQVVYSIAVFFLNAYISGRFFGYGVVQQIQDMIPIFSASAVTALFILGVDEFLEISLLLKVFTLVCLAALFYLLVCAVFKLSAFTDLINVRKSLLAEKSKEPFEKLRI